MSFTAMLEWAVRRHRYRTVAVSAEDGRCQTFGEMGERANRLANALRELGVGKGDRVLLATGNRLEYFESELAIAKLGAVKVPILRSSTATEVRRYVTVTEPRAILATGDALATFGAGVDPSATELPRVVVGDGPNTAPSGHPTAHHRYKELIAEAPATPVTSEIAPEDLYAIRFTGGTTGVPKGVMMDHRSLETLMNVMLVNWDIRADDVCLHIHPVTHASGFIGYLHLLRGARSVFATEMGVSAEQLLDIVHRHRVTTMFTVPTLLGKMLDSPALPTADVSSIRQFIYGGSTIPPARLRQALRVFGPVFVQLYGSSEAPVLVATLQREEHVFDGDEPPQHLRSAGRPGLGVQVEVRREDGTVCAPNEIGEITVRGDNVMHGFWRNEELTASRKIGGWVHTGDIAYQDEDGYLYLMDRKEDLIISGGFNVWPNEVEYAIAAHPAVREAVVFGVPDDYWGQAVVAAVVLRDGTDVDQDIIRAYLADHLVKYKIPKRIAVWPELPKSPVGKPLRAAAREQFRATEPVQPGSGQ